MRNEQYEDGDEDEEGERPSRSAGSSAAAAKLGGAASATGAETMARDEESKGAKDDEQEGTGNSKSPASAPGGTSGEDNGGGDGEGAIDDDDDDDDDDDETAHRAAGIIEHAVLFGTPASTDRSEWASARAVVSGQLINAFNEDDWLLPFAFRASNWMAAGRGVGVAGVEPVESVPGVTNVNLTQHLSGHGSYQRRLGLALTRVQIECGPRGTTTAAAPATATAAAAATTATGAEEAKPEASQTVN